MKKKICQKIEIHHLGDVEACEMTFGGGMVLVVSAAAPPPGQIHYEGNPDWTEVRLLAPGLTPNAKGFAGCTLVVGSDRKASYLPQAAPDTYVSRREKPAIEPWADLLLTSNGPESGSIPDDHPDQVSLYHY